MFFQQQFRFFERPFMSGGFRTEDNSVFGTETAERGALSYLISGWGTRLRGGAGSGFRAPAFNELFFPDFGNPATCLAMKCDWSMRSNLPRRRRDAEILN